jgi:glucan phosphoethanolaminetransferase (alkaline phosphatase superfamily)
MRFAVFFLLGLIAFIASLIWLIIGNIKKKNDKKPFILMVVSMVELLVSILSIWNPYAFVLFNTIILIVFLIKYKIKKPIRIVLAILASLLIIICVVFETQPIIIPDSQNLTDEALAMKIAQGWLNYDKIGPFASIEDYQIISAELNSNKQYPNVDVHFNVKPTPDSYDDWNAGNGNEGKNGWLIDKSTGMSYYKFLDFYFILSVGNG